MTFKKELVEIGDHNGWTFYYNPVGVDYVAKKGRKQIKVSNHDRLIPSVEDRDAEDKRKKSKTKVPCKFKLWDEDSQIIREVELTSYSAKGLGLRDCNESKVFFLKKKGYGYGYGGLQSVPVVPDYNSGKRLLQAVEGLRRAETEMRAALKEAVVKISAEVESGRGRWHSPGAKQYHEAEDRIRDQINKLNSKP